MPTVAHVIDALLARYRVDEVIVADVWDVDDILARAEARRRIVGRHEAEAFIEDIAERIASSGGNAGIDWELIDHYIDNPADF